jgi:hypothetical protein
LALNFRLAVNMLQLIYALKKHNNFQRLPSPGFHLNARYILVIDLQSLIKDCLVFKKSHLSTCNFSGLMNAICQNVMWQ